MADRRRKTNAEIREWYVEVVSLIPELNRQWLTAGLAARPRAFVAWSIRHTARLKAREMMVDPNQVKELQARDRDLYGNPNGPKFEDLVRQWYEAGLRGQAIYEAIIEKASGPNDEINRQFGL